MESIATATLILMKFALIDLRYDTGDLDDYVPTASINTVTDLDVSGSFFSYGYLRDITDIEAFTILKKLYCY
ncbi:MAG: hypothetical protein ACERIH_03470 [Labilibaculum antarcticum]